MAKGDNSTKIVVALLALVTAVVAGMFGIVEALINQSGPSQPPEAAVTQTPTGPSSGLDQAASGEGIDLDAQNPQSVVGTWVDEFGTQFVIQDGGGGILGVRIVEDGVTYGEGTGYFNGSALQADLLIEGFPAQLIAELQGDRLVGTYSYAGFSEAIALSR